MIFDDSAINDAVLVQTLYEVRIHASSNEILEPVGLRLFERAADIVRGNRDLFDLVLIEQCLEAAVRDRRQLGALQVEILNEKHAEHGGDDVPEVDVDLLIYLIHGWPARFRSCAAKPRPDGTGELGRKKRASGIS